MKETAPLDTILIATGSEVQHAVAAREDARRRARAWCRCRASRASSARPADYREAVLPPSCTRRVSIEAGVTLGWQKYVGLAGKSIGLDRFGNSAPGATVMEKRGITAAHVVEAAKSL